jgi:hypothetical protein
MWRLAMTLLGGALALGPAAAHSQAAGPSVACETLSLHIGAAEVNGYRVHCSVSGAAGDQVLRVVSDQTRAVCEVALGDDGSGECIGIALGSLEAPGVDAYLLPSGRHVSVVAQQTSEGAAQLQYTPLPPSDVD